MKLHHDCRIDRHQFAPGDLVLFLNSRLRMFPGKLKSKCLGPYKVTRVLQYGVVELESSDGTRCKVNGQRIKAHFGNTGEIWMLDEVSVIK